MRDNKPRVQFVKAWFGLMGPHVDPKILFDKLNETLSEVVGYRVYKDYNAFQCSKNHLVRKGKVKTDRIEHIRRPHPDDNHITCPSCASKLVFK